LHSQTCNIKQIARQKGPNGRGQKRLHNRSRAAKEFRKDENRERWGVILAMGWNLKVLNRLRCRKMQEDAGDEGDINHTGELGDNLLSLKRHK